jgi:hypothetical protein
MLFGVLLHFVDGSIFFQLGVQSVVRNKENAEENF